MERETKELTKAERIEFVKTIASELTKLENVNSAAGTAWKLKPSTELNDNWPTLYIVNVGNAECEISVHFDYPKKGKLFISGNFHIGRGTGNRFVDVREYVHGIGGKSGGYAPLPEITVTTERGAQTIAREISRRFLPDYLHMFAKATKRRDSDNAYQDQKTANMQRLASAMNIDPSRIKDAIERDRDNIGNYHNDGPYVDAQVFRDSCTLKISNLSIDKAERIINMIENGTV